MTDTTFESLLSGRLRDYAEAGVRPIDRFAIAEDTIAAGRPPVGARWLLGRRRGALVPILVGLLVLAFAASAVLVGSRLLRLLPFQLPHSYVNELVAATDLPTPMAHPVLVPLVDGRVLTIDNDGGQPASAGLYDPATGAFVQAGPMVSPDRFVGSAVLLTDGRVLIAGDGVAQVFDPTTLRFAPVGPMVIARSGAHLAVLRDGRVLVAGGMPPGGNPGVDPALRSAELFDPDTLAFSPTGSMANSQGGGAMATLADGRVFVATSPTAEIYDPGTGTFSAASTTSTPVGSIAVAIPDGRVVVLGSTGLQAQGLVAAWDPTSRTFSMARGLPGPVSSATLLDDGRIFLTGGRYASWAGIYDPTIEATTESTPPTAWRPSATRLADGRVLIVGGLIDGIVRPGPGGGGEMAPALPTVEIFQ